MKRFHLAWITIVLIGTFITPHSAQGSTYFDIKEIETPKGITFWYVQDDTAPVIALKFLFHGGALTDPKGKEGRANLTAITLDEGAEGRDAYTFQKALVDHGIRLSFRAGLDSFSGTLKTTTMHSELAKELARDALLSPRFDEDAIMRMKNATQTGLRYSQSDPSWHASRQLFSNIYGEHPYARDVEGTTESIANITRSDLIEYRDRYFTKDNLIVGIAGDLTAVEAAFFVDQIFGGLSRFATRPDIEYAEYNNLGQHFLSEWDAPQAVITFAQKGIPRTHEDWFTARIIDHTLGGGGFTARLNEELRVKRGLTYGIGTSLIDFDYAPLYLGQASVPYDKTEEVIGLIKKEFERIRQFGITAEELETAKAYINGVLPLSLTSTSNIAALLVQMQDDELPLDYLNYRKNYVNSVTLGHANTFAKDWLQPDQLIFSVVGPKAIKDAPEVSDDTP